MFHQVLLYFHGKTWSLLSTCVVCVCDPKINHLSISLPSELLICELAFSILLFPFVSNDKKQFAHASEFASSSSKLLKKKHQKHSSKWTHMDKEDVFTDTDTDKELMHMAVQISQLLFVLKLPPKFKFSTSTTTTEQGYEYER